MLPGHECRLQGLAMLNSPGYLEQLQASPKARAKLQGPQARHLNLSMIMYSHIHTSTEDTTLVYFEPCSIYTVSRCRYMCIYI